MDSFNNHFSSTSNGHNGSVESGAKQSKTSNHNNLGLYTLNQIELKNELKRIDLCRRQYELSYVHEQRKLITRVANKLIHSNSNLDVIFKSARNNGQMLRGVNVQKPQPVLEVDESARRVVPPLSFKRGLTHIGFLSPSKPQNDSTSRYSSRPITSLPPPTTATSTVRTTISNELNDNFPKWAFTLFKFIIFYKKFISLHFKF